MTINNKERQLWVWNDEPLYRWWLSESKNNDSESSLMRFIRANREEIDQYIKSQTN